MLQPRLRSSAAALEPSVHNVAALFNSLTLCAKHARVQTRPQLVFVRHATHAAQGRANGPKDSAGRRLGLKRNQLEYVVPGNIIFKQRGTLWFPGENVGIGKDHTIYAKVAGYVRYYRNPALHPKRRYIGIALEKEGPGSKLPSPPNAPTRRRLGMHLVPMKSTDTASADTFASSENPIPAPSQADVSQSTSPLPTAPAAISLPTTPSTFKAGTFWPSNYEIGRAAEKKGIQVREYDRKDRWLAWRKRTKKTKARLLARAAKATRKTKGKKSNKGTPIRKKA